MHTLEVTKNRNHGATPSSASRNPYHGNILLQDLPLVNTNKSRKCNTRDARTSGSEHGLLIAKRRPEADAGLARNLGVMMRVGCFAFELADDAFDFLDGEHVDQACIGAAERLEFTRELDFKLLEFAPKFRGRVRPIIEGNRNIRECEVWEWRRREGREKVGKVCYEALSISFLG